MERARLALTLALGLAACRDDGAGAHAVPIPGDRGARVVVEVLNASGKAGLARTATRVLRQHGIDVVFFGNGAPDPGVVGGVLDSTRIVVRRGGAEVGERVRQGLGVGRVTVDLDAARLLDVSVYLGADFSPRLDFHP